MNLALHFLFGLVAGALIAAAHLATLAPGVRWLTEGRAAGAIALLLGRMAALGAVLLALALAGPTVLMGAIVGLLVIRTLIIRKMAGGET
jgi:hypothetical protein